MGGDSSRMQYGLLGLQGLAGLFDNQRGYTTNIAEATMPRRNAYMEQLPGQIMAIQQQQRQRQRDEMMNRLYGTQIKKAEREDAADEGLRAAMRSGDSNAMMSAYRENFPKEYIASQVKDPKRYVVGGSLVDDSGKAVYTAPEKPATTDDIKEYQFAKEGGYKGSFPDFLASKRAPQTTDSTSDIKEYQFAVRQGFKGSLEEWMRSKRGGAGEYGMTPIWGVDAEGKTTIGQLGKGGVGTLAQFPNGFTPANKPIEVDAGTETILLDPQTRQPIGRVPKNVAGVAAQREAGTAAGQAQVALPAAESTASTMKQYIAQLRDHPGRDKATGPIVGRLPPMAGEAYDFNQRFEQVKGQAFLKAFESLRGAGSITENEGQAATKAISRLDRATSKKEFDAALDDLEEVVNKALNVQRTKAGASEKTATMADVRYTAMQNKVSEAEVIKRLKAQGFKIEGAP